MKSSFCPTFCLQVIYSFPCLVFVSPVSVFLSQDFFFLFLCLQFPAVPYCCPQMEKNKLALQNMEIKIWNEFTGYWCANTGIGRYDNVTLSPLMLPARVTNRSHSTYGKSTMDWCNVYLTPQGLPKYIYLSPPLIFPTTFNGIRTKNRPVSIRNLLSVRHFVYKLLFHVHLPRFGDIFIWINRSKTS
jgi:hypothetical protein